MKGTMAKKNLTHQVKSLVKELGADMVGVAPVERFDMAPAGHKPQDVLPGARCVIVFAFRMLESTFVSPNPRVYAHKYWQLNSKLESLGYDISRYLEDAGYYAVNLPSTAPLDMGPQARGLFADFSYRHAAVEAGLGQIGWNQLLITPKFGPRVWLQAVITTAPLTADQRFEQNLCPGEECSICTNACPQGALSSKGTDKIKCIRLEGKFGLYGVLSHIRNILRETDPKEREELIYGETTRNLWMSLQYGGGPSHCHACISTCPVSREK